MEWQKKNKEKNEERKIKVQRTLYVIENKQRPFKWNGRKKSAAHVIEKKTK